MNNANIIVDQLLDLAEEVGTGIYMKQLDSGRRVFSCKCPVCGTIHGGYRTFGEAFRNKKCREHFRNEIEKTRKEIEKVDEPKKQKSIFQGRLNKPSVIGESGSPRIRGEYWITGDGVWFADGDIGDMNHNMYARETCIRKILDFFSADSDEEFYDEDMFRKAIIEALEENGIEANDENWVTLAREFIRANSEKPAETEAIFLAALDEEDPRDVAVQYFGWIWCRGNNLSTWTYDRKDILDGIFEIIQQEGGDDTEDWNDLDLEIFVASTKKRLSVTLGDLESGRTPGHDPTWPSVPGEPEGPVQEAEDDSDLVADGDWKDAVDAGPDYIAYEVFDGREYYPVTRDGFIGRQGYGLGEMSGQWKVFGMTYSPQSNSPETWEELKLRVEKEKSVSGYLWDVDHGTTRKWGRTARIWRKSVVEEDEDVDAILSGCDRRSGEVNKSVCENSFIGQEFWHRHQRHLDGSPMRFCVSGQCLTWESRPNEFRLPIKYGLFQTFYITEHNAGEFVAVQPT